MRSLRSPLFASVLSVIAIACSSPSTEPFIDRDVGAAPANPEGAAYPTDHIGTRYRTTQRPGDRLQNFAFQGYVRSNKSGGLKTVSMADFYDPEAKRHRVLHLQGLAAWCPICASEAAATQKEHDALEAEGAVIVQILLQGKTRNVGASLTDLDAWVGRYSTKHTVLLDVDAKRLGVFGIDGFPWNALVDTRTMEILHQGVGAPQDLAAYVRDGLRLAKGPPATWP